MIKYLLATFIFILSFQSVLALTWDLMWIPSMGNHGAAGVSQNAGILVVLVIVLMPSRALGDAWWRHQMETFSALLILCTGIHRPQGDFLAQRPVTRNFNIFYIFFDLHLNNCHAGDLRPHRAHYYITVMTRMWCLSLCSSLTPYNITFPFGTFINIYVVQCRLILKRCLQLHVKGVNICLHLTHLCYYYLQSITLNPQRYWQTHITLVSQIVFLNHEYIENGKYIRSVL